MPHANPADEPPWAAVASVVSSNWSGVLVCTTIACAATFLSQHYGGPQLLYALLIGLAFHFLHDNPQLSRGVDFCARTLLRAGVALLGARITLDQVAHLGLETAAIVSAGLVLTIVCGLLLARAFRRPPHEGLLTGGAVAICGASAAMAISACLPGSKEVHRATLFTVVGVTVFSTAAMVLYPFILHFVPLTAVQKGIFLGGTIHDVAQVVAAGTMLGEESADAATLVKLLRVLMLMPVVLVVTVLARRWLSTQSSAEGHLAAPLIPGFLIAFAGLVIASSLNLLPSEFTSIASDVSRWLLVMAIAAAGIKTSFADLQKLGWTPVLMLLIETVFIAAFVLALLLI